MIAMEQWIPALGATQFVKGRLIRCPVPAQIQLVQANLIDLENCLIAVMMMEMDF